MYNCIFTAHCTEQFCDKSCPTLVETSYLLERNGIEMDDPIFSVSDDVLKKFSNILDEYDGKVYTSLVSGSRYTTVQVADIITYVAICKNWRGSRLHCTVYNLRFSKYLDELKKSWSAKSEPETLEYMRIFSESAKVLIISNLDYVNFGDFESQTMLNLLQERQSREFTTILVSPPINQLVSTKGSVFFNRLKSILADSVKAASLW